MSAIAYFNYTLPEIRDNYTIYDTKDQMTPKSMFFAITISHQLITAFFMFLYSVGYLLLEYGSTRRKNSETVLIKSMVIFAVSILSVYTLGYGFAYGESYFIG